ncbi:hypothetical protein NEOLEDRAFT_1145411 [Neolentinus lepideus HHB14362 ss-1]|uniref:Protein kinase domain-containing protein n=1 Tax=Neolentinus lepideus HHB14362 ss-1 TaxID=1314782 RepID=A0A165V3X2_9AGAM|nr:hypothetical protein NEOLEDRAFT_1145411 [Neolentinus lepideus HHB14362 ss-1]
MPDDPKTLQMASATGVEGDLQGVLNHCVPTYEILDVLDDAGQQILAIPSNFGTTLHLIQSEYLSSSRLSSALMNCILSTNIQLHIDVFHPVRINLWRDLRAMSGIIPGRSNLLKYYFIDFGVTRRCRVEDMPPIEKILQDVYYMGNVVWKQLMELWSGVVPRDESTVEGIFRSIGHCYQRVEYIVKRTLAVPMPA